MRKVCTPFPTTNPEGCRAETWRMLVTRVGNLQQQVEGAKSVRGPFPRERASPFAACPISSTLHRELKRHPRAGAQP